MMEWSEIGGYLLIFISIFGVLGNLLVIVAVIRSKKLQVLCNYLVVSLSVTDGILCGFVLPLHAQSMIRGRWVLDDYMCRVLAIGGYVILGISVVTLGSIALNRYFTCVCFAWKSLSSKKVVLIMMAVNYIYPILPMMPAMTGMTSRQEFQPKSGRCAVIPTGVNLPMVHITLIILIPTTLMTFSYIRIGLAVQRSKRSLQAHNQNDTTAANAAHKLKSEFRLAKTMGLVYLSFVVCFVPSFIVNAIPLPKGHPLDNGSLVILVYFSTCLNPVIYGLAHHNFRQAYIDIFCASGLCKKPTVSPATTHTSNSATVQIQ